MSEQLQFPHHIQPELTSGVAALVTNGQSVTRVIINTYLPNNPTSKHKNEIKTIVKYVWLKYGNQFEITVRDNFVFIPLYWIKNVIFTLNSSGMVIIILIFALLLTNSHTFYFTTNMNWKTHYGLRKCV